MEGWPIPTPVDSLIWLSLFMEGATMSATGSAPVSATGEKVLQIARQHMGEKYVLGVLVPKNNAGWTGPWDCAEFAC